MASQIVKGSRPALKQLKTVLSSNSSEARQRVLNLYKLWYRQIPYVGMICLFKNSIFTYFINYSKNKFLTTMFLLQISKGIKN